MSSKEIALRLQEIRRQPFRPIAIEERQRRRKRWSRNADFDRNSRRDGRQASRDGRGLM